MNDSSARAWPYRTLIRLVLLAAIRALSSLGGGAGEIGHLPLAPAEIVYSCGRRGCVETVASSAAILGSIREAQRDPELTLREAVQLARSGNPNAVRAFDRAAAIIGMALATMTNLVGPSVIVVMGESVTDYDLYEQRIRESFDQHTFGQYPE